MFSLMFLISDVNINHKVIKRDNNKKFGQFCKFVGRLVQKVFVAQNSITGNVDYYLAPGLSRSNFVISFDDALQRDD